MKLDSLGTFDAIKILCLNFIIAIKKIVVTIAERLVCNSCHTDFSSSYSSSHSLCVHICVCIFLNKISFWIAKIKK